MVQPTPLRIGILGAAGITPKALVAPARDNPDVLLVAVAARSRSRAEAFAQDQGVDRVLDSYEDLLAAPDVDAIYIPLPNSEHARWTIAALEAGKHVLVEKPFASNLAEAEVVARVAAQHPELVVMEAFHNRYHALTSQVRQLLDDGVIGEVTGVGSVFNVSLADRTDIRYDYALAGGSTMDLGCYPIHMLRTLLGEPEVHDATALPADHPLVDEELSADLLFPGDIPATITSSLNEPVEEQSLTITGSRGSIHVEGFVQPQDGNRVTVTVDGLQTSHEVTRVPSSYAAQLTAFVGAVRGEDSNLTGVEDSLATMRVIDAVYEAAGLGARVVSEPSLLD